MRAELFDRRLDPLNLEQRAKTIEFLSLNGIWDTDFDVAIDSGLLRWGSPYFAGAHFHLHRDSSSGWSAMVNYPPELVLHHQSSGPMSHVSNFGAIVRREFSRGEPEDEQEKWERLAGLILTAHPGRFTGFYPSILVQLLAFTGLGDEAFTGKMHLDMNGIIFGVIHEKDYSKELIRIRKEGSKVEGRVIGRLPDYKWNSFLDNFNAHGLECFQIYGELAAHD